MSRTPLAKAGVLHAGGRSPDHLKEFFFEPTVIANATKDMDVATDETFGPLAAIFIFLTPSLALRDTCSARISAQFCA